MASTLADRPALPRRLRTYRKKQRGIILLMVVSLLALFLLMGVTFAILAIQYKTAADIHAQRDRYGDPAVNETDLGLGAVLFDSSGRGSLRGHSLLRDLYGTDYVQTTVTIAPNTVSGYPRKSANGQFVVFGINTTSSAGNAVNVNTPGYYNSRVITFITGAAAGISSRIAGYEPFEPTGPELYIEPLVGSGGNQVLPSAQDVFVINGAPFNGMGFGYDPATWRLDAVDENNRPVSLLPHFGGYTSQQAMSTNGTPIAPDLGGADEPWDAPDLQNLHISVVPAGLLASANAGNPNRFSLPLIPSFHRPELVNYWLDSSRWPGGSSIQLASNQDQRNLARSIIFRPMPWDHPNFTGSNPDLTPNGNSDVAYEPLLRLVAQQAATNSNNPQWQAIWDVDNDGDGVRESIWIDLGLPVMTSPSGRRYKRLHAILIKDLDGRVNLNVHGNLGQARFSAQTNIDYPFHVFGPSVQPAGGNFPHNRSSGFTATRQLQLPRGMGFGPAEVDFRWLLGTASLTGDYFPLLSGRYGIDGQPGMANVDDPFGALKMSGVPGNYLNDSWYGSLPDVWGRNAVAVDFGGRPFFYRESITAPAETADDPYEMHWDPTTAINDAPYNVADMERLARIHDSDINGFPARLPTISTALFNGAGQPATSPANASYQRLRESFTTMSSHIPTIPSIMRREHRPGLSALNASTVFDLYRQKYREGGGLAIANNPSRFREELAKIMPWEFWQGKPLDLNRYLSNGVNDNASPTNQANGEPIEAASGETAFGTNGSVPSGGNLPAGFSGRTAFHANGIDANGDGAENVQDRILARQLLARHLYCLMMALNGNGYDPPNVSTAGTQATTARMFAQWAINIVDFRDTDGIMTGFEYDINPWNGWTVDGNLATTNDPERGVVWGCEAPELILSEAMAFHDRRVKDTRFDTSGKERNETDDPDEDVDQFRIPQGSLFFELYCARTHNSYTSGGASESIYNPHMPFELYDRSTGRLALDRTAPDGSPVWQVAIARLRGASDPTGFPQYQTQNNRWEDAYYADPADPPVPNRLQYNYAGQTIDIERYVWFTNSDGGAANPKRNRVFYNADRYNPQLSPGQYMVVGPRTNTYLGSNRVNNGSGSGYWGGNSLQRITLSKTTGVEVMDAMNNSTSRISVDPNTAEIQPTAAMAVMTRPPDGWTGDKRRPNVYTHWRGVNITEPLPNTIAPTVHPPFYPEYDAMNDGRNPFDAYDDPAAPQNSLPDVPMDNSRLIGDANMLETRTYPNRSALFLQRLADPTRPWNAQDNPYITVDFASVDISVFTGEEDTNRDFATDPNDPNSPRLPIDPDDRPGNRPGRYGTLQRAQNPQARGNPWYPTFTDTNLTNPVPQSSGQAYFSSSIHHTFGYLNEDLGQVRTAASSGGSRAYVGDPSDADKPFPWITWNNRPYMNAAELLLVPTSAPNRLVLEISPDNQAVPNDLNANPYSPSDGRELRRPFAHLMNMFQSSAIDTTSMNMSRLLDYVEVPSNFVETERWYTPDNLSNTAAPPASRPEYAPPYLYRPPFNKLSRFRDPGKININTIYDFVRDPSTNRVHSPTWNAIVGYDAFNNNGLSGVTTRPVDEIFQSRQGYGGLVGQMNNGYPTIFANPFRPADTADLMPNAANMRSRLPVEVSLLRPSTTRTREPLFTNQSTNNPNESDRHAYFRYQGLQKLPNIIGTQSNCYAVWITVGYFEVEDNRDPTSGALIGPDVGHPDGYMLGQELGLDMGDTQRHRAFYLIDRSIPVGFIPGVKLNTDNAVLLRRQIE